jgi:GTP-binding protein
VLNKTDLLAADEIDAHCQAIVEKLNWQGQIFQISAATGAGCEAVCRAILNYLEQQDSNNEITATV